MASTVDRHVGKTKGPIRKKAKISELPITSAKRSTIDGMLRFFKKGGEFDALRKQIYAHFEEESIQEALKVSLKTFAEAEIEREPLKYLAKDRRQAALLLEGAVARTDIYSELKESIDEQILAHFETARQTLRQARLAEIGIDAAQEEQLKGAKTDKEYEAEAETRRQERHDKYLDSVASKKKKEKEEARKRELEALKRRELELKYEKQKLEVQQRRREEIEAKLSTRHKEKIDSRVPLLEKPEIKAKDDIGVRTKNGIESESRRKEREAEEARRLEQQAMQLLLKEGEKMTEKSTRRNAHDQPSSDVTARRIGGTSRISRLAAEGQSSRSRPPTSLSHSASSSRHPSTIHVENSPVPKSSSSSLLSKRESGAERRESTSERVSDNSTRRESNTIRDHRDPREQTQRRHRSRSRSRSPKHDKRRSRERSTSPGHRRFRDRSRSRSQNRRNHGDRNKSPLPRRRSRSRSPENIDRYVPGSGSRKAHDLDREKERDKERDKDRLKSRPLSKEEQRRQLDLELDRDRERRRGERTG